MLTNLPWLKNTDYLEIELLQSRDEGKDVDGYREQVKRILAMDPNDPEREKQAGELLDEIASIPVEEGYPYLEPSDIEDIKAARPVEGKNVTVRYSNDYNKLYDRVYGAWLGRCAGCLLGKPIEGWHRDRIIGLQKETGNYPFNYYISSDVDTHLKEKYKIEDNRAWINKVCCAPEDDDTNYTVIGLKILESYGIGFTPDDVARTWLNDLPFLHVCTAERVAYKNFVNLISPPQSASFRNPYREWIGAQIRGDIFGYITPGNPELGAELAWRDACISHVKNGIYGEMFVAAMLSWAFVTDDLEEIIKVGMAQVPENSRLTQAVEEVLSWKSEGISWEEAVNRIHSKYNEKNAHDWCHTISNAMVVCVGLLFGELDFEKSIGIAVSAAFDTDCNGATVGSIVGMILGAGALPVKWISPLNDQLKSGVDGFNLVKISDMAKRTVDIISSIK